jgi:hypothetical protein
MAAPEQLARLAQIGNRPLEPAAALRALGEVLGSNESGLTVADIDWAQFREV